MKIQRIIATSGIGAIIGLGLMFVAPSANAAGGPSIEYNSYTEVAGGSFNIYPYFDSFNLPDSVPQDQAYNYTVVDASCVANRGNTVYDYTPCNTYIGRYNGVHVVPQQNIDGSFDSFYEVDTTVQWPNGTTAVIPSYVTVEQYQPVQVSFGIQLKNKGGKLVATGVVMSIFDPNGYDFSERMAKVMLSSSNATEYHTKNYYAKPGQTVQYKLSPDQAKAQLHGKLQYQAGIVLDDYGLLVTTSNMSSTIGLG